MLTYEQIEEFAEEDRFSHPLSMGVFNCTKGTNYLRVSESLRLIRDLESIAEFRALLTEVIQKIRSDSGNNDPMAPFAFDASWEAWAIKVDELIAKSA